MKLKRISARKGLAGFACVSMFFLSHAVFLDDLWGVLFWAGQLMIFTTSYFHCGPLDVSISSISQLYQLRFEMEVIPALLIRMGTLLLITGLLGVAFFA